MPFIDWNGNGEIDPDDIAISIAMDDDYDDPLPKSKKQSNSGCATSMLTLLGFILLILIIS